MVKIAPVVTVPPSGFVTVMAYVPGVAAPPVVELVGVTLTVMVVAVLPVTAVVSDVPFAVFVSVTVGVAKNPEPVTVTAVAVAAGLSTMLVGVSDVTAGAGSTVNALVIVSVPALSVMVRL